MAKQLTLGSLFDGSGGFPLGAVLNSIKPIWSSEIEPFAIRVTTKRLPFVKHYGDICSINGATIEPVDIISFGSPCTNLSLAGRREGLNGKQSSLFFEAIRVIKEMRLVTNGKYPRFIVWENVPGVYSSAEGEDFRCVLEEIAKLKDETISIPMPTNNKWLTAGEIVGNSYSIAYRTIDAQFWGVAQRRRRCYLIADFESKCAGKILFEFESLSGYTPQSAGSGQGTAGNAENCTGKAVGFEPGAATRLGGHAWNNSIGALRAHGLVNHTHPHSHQVSISAHRHSVQFPSHSHSVTIPSHSHSVTIDGHNHSVSIPAHTHAMDYGIFKAGSVNVGKLYINGKYVQDVSPNTNINLASMLADSKTKKINRNTFHKIEIYPVAQSGNTQGFTRIVANIFMQIFTNSRGSGDF